MTIENVINEIASRLDDIDLYTYVDNPTTLDGRAKRSFANAIYTLLDLKQYSLTDVHGIISDQEILTTDLIYHLESGGYYYYINSAEYINIRNIYVTHKILNLVELQINEYREIDCDFEDYLDNELKYIIIGDNLIFLTKDNTKPNNVFLNIIDAPDLYEISPTTDVTALFSITFINKAIGLAVEQLMRERNSIV